MDTRDTYNRIAEDWHKDHQADSWWQEGVNAFCSYLPGGGRVLDIGCGAGVKAHYLISKGFDVVGVDSSEKMIQIASHEVPNGTFLVGDMRDISGIPGNFDGLFAQASLLHIPRTDAAGVVKSWLPKLTPGGVLYIAVKSARSGAPLEEIKKENDYGYEYERFFSYFTPEEVRALAEAHGLSIVYFDFHESVSTWIQLVAQKPK